MSERFILGIDLGTTNSLAAQITHAGAEVVRDGETGYLARPEDPEDLAACIRRMLADDEARRRMAARCREVAVREYDVALMARRYRELYWEGVERRRAGAPLHVVGGRAHGAHGGVGSTRRRANPSCSRLLRFGVSKV